MKLVQLSVEQPIAVIAAILIIVIMGILALNYIPIQLTPDINRPIINITTIWPNTAPIDIETEIINRQEEVLQDLEGLEQITSSATTGIATVTLEFNLNQDMDKALLLAANRLDRISGYPFEVDKPILQAASAEDSPIAWFILKPLKSSNQEAHSYSNIAKDLIQDYLQRLPGVAKINVYGDADLEMQVIVNPNNLAKFKLTINDLTQALINSDISISAGDIDEGKRRYVIRTQANFSSLQQVRDVVIKSQLIPDQLQPQRITINDIAEIKFGHKDPDAKIRHLGQETIAINAIRETGANVIKTMDNLKKSVDYLNKNELAKNNLYLKQVYDETVYINSAVDLVQQNIIIGGLLAAGILFLFLRSWQATVIVSLSIPISIIGTFVAMTLLGRSINVISLAGLAFAVGMVVDATIVVLENIFRYREQGESPNKSAINGTNEVLGAVFVSSLTTVVVFLPILTIKLEIGQLFRDIAVAISVAILLSLLTAATVIPALASRLLKNNIHTSKPIPILYNCAKYLVNNFINYLEKMFKHKSLALYSVFSITLLALLSIYLLLPKLEYLPEGNRNLIFGLILPPPGYNLDTTFDIAKNIENSAKPLWATETGRDSPPGTPPKIDNFFFVARNNIAFVGATAVQTTRAKELIPILSKPIFAEPGTFGFITQSSLFGRSVTSGRTIDLDISGNDLGEILQVAKTAMFYTEKVMPRREGNQYRPQPGLELGAPEIRVLPDNIKIKDNSLSNRDLATAIKVFNQGLKVTEITIDGKRLDLTLMGDNTLTETQQIANIPVVTPNGQILPVSSLADVIITAGPTEIRHKDSIRTITLQIRPNDQIPLEKAMEILQTEVINKININKNENIKLNLSGTANKLTSTWDAIVGNLIVALIVVYFVMAILFESFFYPLIILFSVPIAAFGGVLGLAVLNLFIFQPLDMLTMLGFVILIGIVVNNAILLVHHTLHHLRKENMNLHDSILLATKYRIRPIFMSTLTSLFGMLPLVLFPGAGSELYRGLGSVVLGGLMLSAVLTLIIVPSLLRFSTKSILTYPE